MNEDRPSIVVVPTELDRQDGFIDLAALASAALAVWWLALQGVPIVWIAPCLIPLAVWVLTGEAAADVPFLGAVAAGLRNVFGLRRAHEWLFAWAHWWHLAVYPVWRANCVAFYRSRQRQIMDWLRLLSAKTRWLASHASLWVSATRYSLLVRLGRST